VPRQIVVDHITLDVTDLERSQTFYKAALAPLGYGVVYEQDDWLSFGVTGSDDFAIRRASGPVSGPLHVAFAAPDPEAVASFHAAGLAAGGLDNGAPGYRPQYHQTYFAAYVLDPDGNNVEAVHHGRG
jgi:catechol 2,3-dioxygenase-like lactoylglutathione lyase family enzyme